MTAPEPWVVSRTISRRELQQPHAWWPCSCALSLRKKLGYAFCCCILSEQSICRFGIRQPILDPPYCLSHVAFSSVGCRSWVRDLLLPLADKSSHVKFARACCFVQSSDALYRAGQEADRLWGKSATS
jgi:hypothetical protein